MKRITGGYKTMSWVGPGKAGHTDKFARHYNGRVYVVEVYTANLSMDEAQRSAYKEFLKEVERSG